MTDNDLHSKDLLKNVASGDGVAMRFLFHTHYPRLLFYANSIINNNDEAADIAQEALTLFWQQRKQWHDKALPQAEAFLFTTVRNKCLNFLKHLKVRQQHQEAIRISISTDDHTLELLRMEEAVLNQIFLEIDNLPQKYAHLLKLIFVEGLSVTDIADRLGITPNNVRNQKARALEKLRTTLLQKHLYAEAVFIFIFFPEFL